MLGRRICWLLVTKLYKDQTPKRLLLTPLRSMIAFTMDQQDRKVLLLYLGCGKGLSPSAQLVGVWLNSKFVICNSFVGKTFGVTGWRIGWLLGDNSLLKWVLAVHARTVFTSQTPAQVRPKSSLTKAVNDSY